MQVLVERDGPERSRRQLQRSLSRASVPGVNIPQALTVSTLLFGCAHAAPAPAATSQPLAAEPSELWCGPIACPGWLASETNPGALPLRERCGLLSKVLMFQPLALVGRPL